MISNKHMLYFGFMQDGLPLGVLNVISGFGPTIGAAMSKHMAIDKVLN